MGADTDDPRLSLLPGGGDTVEDATPRDVDLEVLTAQILSELQEWVPLFAAHVPLESLPPLARSLAEEQLGPLAQVVPAMDRQEEHYPVLVLQLGDLQGIEAEFSTYKRFERTDELQFKGLLALMLGLLATPAARGLLRLHGIAYGFQQRPDPKRPRLITAP